MALRAVTSSDGMTADWYPFEPDFLQYVSTKICNTVKGVNRVVYDVTSKPCVLLIRWLIRWLIDSLTSADWPTCARSSPPRRAHSRYALVRQAGDDRVGMIPYVCLRLIQNL